MTVTVHLLLVPTQWDPLVVRVIILPAEMAELVIYLQVTRKIRGFVTGRDAGRNVRLFDMQRPVVHTRNTNFLSVKIVFFHFLTKDLTLILLT